MAIFDSQKVDYLWKKLGYGRSKTDVNSIKNATNESIASPLFLRGDVVWSQSNLIPSVIPGASTGVVQVYPSSSPIECTNDITASSNRTWKTGQIDWIPPEIGDTYLIKVYIHTSSDAANASSSGTQLFAAGSGNDDEWFFDYQSGTLNFIGDNLPNGVNFTGKSVYIVGARYTGIKGVSAPGSATNFTDVTVSGDLDVDGHTDLDNVSISGVTTTSGLLDIDAGGQANTFKVEDLTDNRIVIAGTGGELEDDANLTFNGSTLSVGVDLDVDGQTELDHVNVSGVSTFAGAADFNGNVDIDGRTELDITNIDETLNVTGISTFASAVDINADLDVDGRTELDITNIAETLNVVGVSTFASNVDINADIDVDGLSELDDVNVSGAATVAGILDVNGGLQANTAIIEDLTNNRIVIAGVGGELEDDANLTFNGSTLAVGVDLNVTGDLDVDGHTELDQLRVAGVSTFAGDVDISSGGNLTVAGNLIVDGTQTILNTTQLEVEDINIGIASANPKLSNAALDGAGITIHGADGDKTLTWNNTNSRMEFNTDLHVPNITSTDLTLTGDLDVDGHTELDQLRVAGVSTFASTVDINADLDVDGRTELDITNVSDTLNVVGVSTFASVVDINADLDVDGHTDLDNVSISGVTTVAGTLDADGGLEANTVKVEDLTDNRVVISGPGGELEDDANFTFNGTELSVGVNLDVDGRSELDITNIAETLNVVGVSTFASNVDINADLDVDGRSELDITNIAETLNVAGISTFASAVDINSDLDVDGTTELDVLNVAETATFSSNIDANGDLDVDGHTELDNLNVSGVSTFASTVDINADLDVDGHTYLDNVSIDGGVTVSGTFYANGGLEANTAEIKDLTDNRVVISGPGGELEDDANLTFDGSTLSVGVDLDVTGDLDVDGHTELDNVSISGVTTFTGNIDANGDLDVDGLAELDDVNVSGAATVAGTFDANGGLTANTAIIEDLTENRVVISGPGGELEDDANLTFDGSTLSVGVDLDVDGTTELDVLNVAETATFSSNIDANGDLDVDGTTELDVLNVAETATFSSNIDANGDLDVDGHTDLDNVSISGVTTTSGLLDIDAGGQANTFKVEDLTDNRVVIVGTGGELEDDANLTFNGSTLAVGVDLNVTGDLDVDGHTELDNLNVSGLSTFTNAVDINNDLDVDGTTELDVLNVAETATFSANIDANGDLDVDGHTDLDNVSISGVTTTSGLLDVDSGLTANTAIIEDLTDNRIVIAGSGGELEDDANLTYDGTDLSANSLIVTDLTDNRVLLAGSGGAVEDDSNLTFDGSTLTVAVDLDVDGKTELDITNIAETLNVVGVSTFASNVDINADLDVDGHTELDNVNISGVATATAFHTGAEGSAIRVSSDTISGPATLNIDPAAVGDNTGTVVIKGDLQVDGTQTIINSTTVTVNDLNIQVADGAANDAAADGAGITVNSGEGDKTFQFEATGDNFGSSEHLNLASGKRYKINNTGVLSANGLGSGVVNSSLTSVGTLVGLTVSGQTSLDNTEVTGISTFSSSVDINADLDVDGHTNLDNVSISGVTTTSGLLDIDAGGQANTFKVEDLTDNRIVIAGTDGELEDDANLTFNGTQLAVGVDLDVDGHTELDNLNVSGVSTFTSAVDINADLDVDGQTELDHVNVTGVSTFASAVDINANLNVTGVSTLGNTVVGGAATELVVGGDARITGILTIGTSSLTLDGDQNQVQVGSALTIGHTIGLQYHTQNLHADGFEVNNINASGITTSSGVINSNTDIQINGTSVLTSASDEAVALAIALG